MQSGAIRMRITNETAIAATIDTTVGPWVAAEIAVTATLGNCRYFCTTQKKILSTHPNSTCLPVIRDLERDSGERASFPAGGIRRHIWRYIEVSEHL